MQYKYISYEKFDHQVAHRVGGQVYQLNKHYLPQVALIHRDRFLTILYNCDDICKAYAVLNISSRLPDKHFLRCVNYLLTQPGS